MDPSFDDHPSSPFEEKHDYLSERDKIIFERGFRTLLNALRSWPKERLPRVVILPDTSARPFAHGIKKIIDTVCEERGCPRPQYQYIVASRFSQSPKYTAKENRTSAEQQRVTRLRANDIVSQIKTSSPKELIPLLAVDDYYNMGGTFDSLEQAFTQPAGGKKLSLTYFTFFLNDEDIDTPPGGRRRFLEEKWGGRLIAGSSYSDGNDRPFYESSMYAGFAYKSKAVHKHNDGEIFAQDETMMFPGTMPHYTTEQKQHVENLRTRLRHSTRVSRENLLGVQKFQGAPNGTVARAWGSDLTHAMALSNQITSLAEQVLQDTK